jgi:hypothetical protein
MIKSTAMVSTPTQMCSWPYFDQPTKAWTRQSISTLHYAHMPYIAVPKHRHNLVGRMIPWGLFGRDKLRRSCSTLSHILQFRVLHVHAQCSTPRCESYKKKETLEPTRGSWGGWRQPPQYQVYLVPGWLMPATPWLTRWLQAIYMRAVAPRVI